MYYRARNNKTRIELYVEETVPFHNLDDFRRFFRVSRATIECLCRNIAHFQQLQPGWTGGREFISTDKHLLISLWYLATQDSIHSISDRFNVTESSVIRCRTRITDISVNHLKQVFILLPSANERQEIMDKFEQKQNFPGVLCALDGTHIAIKAPKNHPETYVNRKGFYSIILQGICREDLRFIHCIAGWPGSCHDAKVFKNTDIWENGLAVCGNGHFLGDGAYPLRSWLLTPYRDTGHLTPQQRNYNYRHSGTRVTIERALE
ncbi:putative nuclease HARBI1, partial [Saccostrea cucullata]|uniref:putative nuclease HARBI1 n=1 Tax=Saccostrea cuccullata TaxID=36930 RepID=UPI002ED33F25